MLSPAQAFEVLGRETDGMSREEYRELIGAAATVRAYADAREAVGLRGLAALDPDPADPARDTADRLQREQNIGRGEARRRAETAEQLGHLDDTQDALEEGRITGEHAAAMAAGRAKADARARAALEDAEAELLEQAEHESPQDFRKRVDRFIAEHQSTQDGLDEHGRRRARNSLRFWNDRDGMKRMSGAFDPDLGAEIEAEVRRKAEDRWRAECIERKEQKAPASVVTNERRMAEALGEVCRRSFGSDVRDGRRPVSRVGVTMTLDQLMGRDDRPAERRDGSPIPAAVARKKACADGVIPIVLNGQSIPVDWGRTRRYGQPNQFEALALLHPTCTLFGCTAPVDWTDLHHIEHYEDGGPTDLANLTPSCDHCHDLVHRPGWGAEKLPNSTVHSWAPDGREWFAEPRRRTGPQTAAAPDSFRQPTLV
ncbi:MAG TPA: DUF222 domain-containing protein [Acidimicrobiales bacterium]|nr:DUF222 domain-containing protein [Acidimicrobiales bacterium]